MALHRAAFSVVVFTSLGLSHASATSFTNASNGLPTSNLGFDCSSFNPGGWTGVAFADVDGDGDDDLGAVGRLLQGFHVWLSDGAGNWSESSTGLDPSDCHGRSDIDFAYVNGDSQPDLGGVRGINGAPGVYLGAGGNNWTGSSTGLDTGTGEGFTFGDFDGDGNADLATVGHFSGGIRAYFGDGTGSWTERSTGLPANVGGHRAAAGDLDGDLRAELVATPFMTGSAATDGVFAYRWDGSRWGVHASWYFDQPVGVAVADTNRDGWNDVLVAASQDVVGSYGSVRAFLNNGDGRTFTESSSGLPVLDSFYRDLAVGDLDNDGDLDIASGDWRGAYRVFLGDGAGGWFEATPTGLPVAGDTNEGMAAGDMDGDCRLDLAIAGYRDGVQVWRETDPVPCAILADAGLARRMCAGSSVVLDGSASRTCCGGPAEFRWWMGGVLLQDWTTVPTVLVSVATTTLFRLDVACGGSLSCFVSDGITIVVEPDPAPPALGNVLMLIKTSPADILHLWTDVAGNWGHYQVLMLPATLGPPTQATFDGPLPTVAASALPGVERAPQAGIIPTPPAIIYFRVRARSACGFTPGPA